MTGTREISGSDAIRLRNLTMAAFESSMASSMLMSIAWAPASTCWRATDNASSYLPSMIKVANFFEPVTLVRSPILMNVERGFRGSSPL